MENQQEQQDASQGVSVASGDAASAGVQQGSNTGAEQGGQNTGAQSSTHQQGGQGASSRDVESVTIHYTDGTTHEISNR